MVESPAPTRNNFLSQRHVRNQVVRKNNVKLTLRRLIGIGRVTWGAVGAALLILLALAPAASAQPTFVNGQAARLVIGQPTFTRQAPVSSRETIGGSAGIAVVGNRLYIADGNEVGATPLNNRLLIYNDLSSFLYRPDEELPQPGTGLPDDNFCPVCVGLPDTVLGQTDFDSIGPGRPTGFQNVTAVHSDGTTLAVADTDNNRVLIWRTIPTVNGTLPDVVVGQPDFEDGFPRTTATGMRGPQGVWIDSGRLFVADTLNGRVLIFNSIPSSSGASADIVLGQPDFETRPEPDLTQSNIEISASTMLDPVSVTVTNGQMFVTDLGFSRVTIFFSVPTSNFFPADVVIGQIDPETSIANDSTQLCEQSDTPVPSNIDNDLFFSPAEGCMVTEQPEASCSDMVDNDCDGRVDAVDSVDCCIVTQETEQSCDDGRDNDCDGLIDFFNDDDCGPAFPARCGATLHFPRFALSDGEKLYISDSGNDRVLIFNEIPQSHGATADVVLGQADFENIEESTGAASLRAPGALALDGENLYVTDPFTRRVLVFTPAEDQIAQDGLVNGAAFQIRANGSVFLSGDLQEGQRTIAFIGPRQYQHIAVEGDSAQQAAASLLEQINADPFAVVTGTSAVEGGEHASGALTFDGEAQVGDRITLDIGDESYTVEVQAGDEPFVVVDRFLNEIKKNPNSMFYAVRDPTGDVLNVLRVVFRDLGPEGNSIPYSFSLSPGALITVEVEGEFLAGGELGYGFYVFANEPGTAGNSINISTSTALGSSSAPSRSGQQLTGGSDARELPVGTIATMFGKDFADRVWQAESVDPSLPTELGGVRVYVNGVAAPLFTVTPEQVNFLVAFETVGTTISVYVWRQHDDGTTTVSVPRAAEVARASPGLFAFDGPEPRQAIAVHSTGVAQGRIATAVVGTMMAGITASIKVAGRTYSYVTVDDDTSASVRDGLVAAINDAPDPDVVASSATEGFFSARANVTLTGEIQAGDRLTITINGRPYIVVVEESDSLAAVSNKMVEEINSGRGDPEATARRIADFDPKAPIMQVVARVLGEEGNDITLTVAVSEGALLVADTNIQDDDDDTVDGFLRGGQTPPVVLLTARSAGREANEITVEAESSDETVIALAVRAPTLCCGAEPFSLITSENPAAPGEVISVFGTGLGLTAPTPQDVGIRSGQPAPLDPLMNVPFNATDFVSSLVNERAPVILFVGLMPGQVGVYQINMRINESLEDNPAASLDVRQVLFFSNLVTIPVKNIRPRDDAF